MTVVSLQEYREKATPHLAGEAFCLDCHHVWQAVAPIGTVTLECPACSANKGTFRNQCRPEEGALIYMCACGNDLFVITKNNVMCARCGVQPRMGRKVH